MSNILNWKVPSRAQSAASLSSTWSRSSAPSNPSASAPVESAQPLCGMECSPSDLYFSSRYGQSSASYYSCSLPSRPASGLNSTGTSRQPKSPKQYWELGGLGPTSVATPEWQVLKERWLTKQAFGKAATAANRLARLRALGKMQQEDAERMVTETEVSDFTTDEDDSAAVLEERAKKRDIALALKL